MSLASSRKVSLLREVQCTSSHKKKSQFGDEVSSSTGYFSNGFFLFGPKGRLLIGQPKEKKKEKKKKQDTLTDILL
jgi:hypothetical protein